MKKKLLAGLAVGLFMFCMVGLANATPITQEFYVQIGSVEIGDWIDPQPDFNEQQAKADYPGPSVGSRAYGAVSYDNANIPRTGTYIIGLTDSNTFPYHQLPVNEDQLWVMDWDGFDGLFHSAIVGEVGHLDRLLYFKDGKLSGLYVYIMGGEGILDSGFDGTDYSAMDVFPYGENQQLAGVYVVGTLLHITPEPATLLLLGSGLIGLWGLRRKFKK